MTNFALAFFDCEFGGLDPERHDITEIGVVVTDYRLAELGGYTNEPKRCPSCRQAKRAQRSETGGYSSSRPSRQMFPAVCAECGMETQVPFEPREGRPV